MGVQNPSKEKIDPSSAKARFDNPKITFTADIRELWLDICRDHGINPEMIPKDPSEVGLTKNEYILRKQNKELAEKLSQLEEVNKHLDETQRADKLISIQCKGAEERLHELESNLLTAEAAEKLAKKAAKHKSFTVEGRTAELLENSVLTYEQFANWQGEIDRERGAIEKEKTALEKREKKLEKEKKQLEKTVEKEVKKQVAPLEKELKEKRENIRVMTDNVQAKMKQMSQEKGWLEELILSLLPKEMKRTVEQFLKIFRRTIEIDSQYKRILSDNPIGDEMTVKQAIKDVLSQYEDERAAKYEDLPGVKEPGGFFDDEKVETRPQRERTLDD